MKRSPNNGVFVAEFGGGCVSNFYSTVRELSIALRLQIFFWTNPSLAATVSPAFLYPPNSYAFFCALLLVHPEFLIELWSSINQLGDFSFCIVTTIFPKNLFLGQWLVL